MKTRRKKIPELITVYPQSSSSKTRPKFLLSKNITDKKKLKNNNVADIALTDGFEEERMAVVKT